MILFCHLFNCFMCRVWKFRPRLWLWKSAWLYRVSPLLLEQTFCLEKKQFFLFWSEQIFQCQELFPLLQDPGDGLLHNTGLFLVLPATAVLGRRDTPRKVSASIISYLPVYILNLLCIMQIELEVWGSNYLL